MGSMEAEGNQITRFQKRTSPGEETEDREAEGGMESHPEVS